ncbi:MAG: hypothetical protein ACLQNE_22490, partial [Thermoguttaceae bacterium]
DAVFTWFGCMDELEGTLHALLENHYSVDVLAEHQLQPRLKEFPLVVVPDSYKLAPDFKAALLKYVEDGGSLLLLGEKCARLFEPDLGVRFAGGPQNASVELATPAGVVNENGAWQKVMPTTAQIMGSRYPTRDTRKGGEVAATLIGRGKGKIAAVYGPLALNYYRSHHPALRGFLGDVVARLFSHPAVQVDGPPCLDVALRRTKDGKISVHLLNTAGMPLGDRHTMTDFVPPVGPIKVRVRVGRRPKEVLWVPEGGPVPWSWEKDVLSVTVPTVHVHGVVVVCP